MNTFVMYIRKIYKYITWRRVLFFFFFLGLVLTVAPYLLAGYMQILYRDKIHEGIDTVPQTRVAVVLGASLFPDGSPSDILSDRIDAAVELYKAGKVQKIIMSGDNRFENYNEPDAMVMDAIEKGVRAEDLQPDYAGRRTYDTCWRAKHIFSQEQIIIVTQSFHIVRAVFLCSAMGIETDGFIADNTQYRSSQWVYWSFRDTYALVLSVIDVYVRDPFVVEGERIEL